MKELSIEEKAKRYDEALERMKSWARGEHPECFTEAQKAAEFIFPELKENKELDDEKIMKWLIEIVEEIRKTNSTNASHNGMCSDAIAWLEKQGEQKLAEWHREDEQNLNACLGYIPDEYLRRWLTDAIHVKYDKQADKVEPKFHEGDWAVSNLDKKARQISEVHFDEYNSYYVVDGKSVNLEEYDRLHHLWNIKDVKDGDVLVLNNEVFIYAHRKQMYSIAVAHCFVDSAGNFYLDGEFGYKEYGKTISPATKEQRDLLFKKMREAGYEWNREKKELRKIDWNPQPGDTFRKKGTESPIYHLCDKLEDGIYFGFVEEKENGVAGGEISIFALKNEYELVERLKPIEKVIEEEFNKITELKPSWSEEDENMYRKLHNLIYAVPYCDSRKEFSDWLESLKERYTWKPSDEQITWLYRAADDASKDSRMKQVLNELLSDLKKLKGE